jgi:hypothetical protein
VPLLCPSARPSPSPQEAWTTSFNALIQRMRRFFMRQEPYLRAHAYVQGLLSPAERKNGWQVAEEVGEATPYAMQHLLDRAKWECDGWNVLCYGIRVRLAASVGAGERGRTGLPSPQRESGVDTANCQAPADQPERSTVTASHCAASARLPTSWQERSAPSMNSASSTPKVS